MRLNPHMNFDGRCEEAFKFYEKCLGGKISFTMTYGDSPVADHVPRRLAQQDHSCDIKYSERRIDCRRCSARPLSEATRLPCNPRPRGRGRDRTHLQSVVRKWHSADAAASDVLGRPLRHGR